MHRSDLIAGALAAEELQRRRAEDPLLKFDPFPKQREFLGCVLPEAWYSGANRIGKSDALAVWIASLARYGNPNPLEVYANAAALGRPVSIWCISPTFSSSRDIMQPKLFNNGFVPPGAHRPFIPEHEIQDWRAKDGVLILKNGSLIGFKSCDQDIKTFYGVGKDAVCFDEPPSNESIYNECTIRIEAGRRLWIRGACTLLPEEGQTVDGISWLFPAKFQPWLEGRNRDRTAVFTASIYDNPHLHPDEIARLEAIFPEGSIERRIRINGELLQVAGGARAYPPFKRGIHVNPGLTLRDRDFRLPLLWCLDFNVEPMGSTVWQLQRDRNGFGVYRGLCEITIETDASPTHMAEEFRRLIPAHGAEVWIYGDATGKHRGQTGRSNYAILMEALQGSGLEVRVCVPEANPNIQDRINAVNLLLRGPDGRSRVELSSQMRETIADFEQVKRDKNAKIKKTSNKKDPYFRRTSWSDGFGYMAAFREPALRVTSTRTNRSSFRTKQPSYRFGV